MTKLRVSAAAILGIVGAAYATANGYLSRNNIDPPAGLRFRF